MSNAAKNRRGLKDKITNVSFQPLINPIKIPIRNVDVYWTALPSLSPIPSFILLTSLEFK